MTAAAQAGSSWWAEEKSASAATTGGTNWGELASYVWQYYLPRVPGQQAYRIPQGRLSATCQIWVTQGWASVRLAGSEGSRPGSTRILGVLNDGPSSPPTLAALLTPPARNVDLRGARPSSRSP